MFLLYWVCFGALLFHQGLIVVVHESHLMALKSGDCKLQWITLSGMTGIGGVQLGVLGRRVTKTGTVGSMHNVLATLRLLTTRR
ncbi:hypothetical protein F5Y15DRAFT_389084 [Xylariaceae sp. FL0016]|nr:hypothetical protein F5Y15DRAFT_389084 [Xylariaceae sp. FL0016]